MSNMKYFIIFLINIVSIELVFSQGCLDGKSHLAKPVQVDALYEECANWRNLTCCDMKTTFDFHLLNTSWYGFNYHHCGRMSDKCRRRFLQDLCLYECDPYLTTWIVQDTSKKFRTERFYGIPLCKRDCDLWFEDCKEDFTCATNWNKGFVWRNGTNYCPSYSECRKFKDVYKTSENFCNTVWDGSFNVTSDPKAPCISFLFNTTNNPNKEVAEYYLQSGVNSKIYSNLLISFSILIFVFSNLN